MKEEKIYKILNKILNKIDKIIYNIDILRIDNIETSEVIKNLAIAYKNLKDEDKNET